MSFTYFGRIACGIAGVNSLVMGAYHLYLPYQFEWRTFTDSIPEMIQWGIFAINFDMSLLMLILGIIGLTITKNWGQHHSTQRVSLGLIAAFWVMHATYLAINPMPIPAFLGWLKILLTIFAAGIASLSCIAFFAYRQSIHQ